MVCRENGEGGVKYGKVGKKIGIVAMETKGGQWADVIEKGGPFQW